MSARARQQPGEGPYVSGWHRCCERECPH